MGLKNSPVYKYNETSEKVQKAQKSTKVTKKVEDNKQVKTNKNTQSNKVVETSKEVEALKQEQVSSNYDNFEIQVLELTNKERAKEGLKPLEIDSALMQSAKEKSLDMKQAQYFSHNSPTLGSPFDQMKKNGISYKAAGENIAKGQRTPEEVVTAWMNSPGHRANIMSNNYTHIGIGYMSNGYIWTQ